MIALSVTYLGQGLVSRCICLLMLFSVCVNAGLSGQDTIIPLWPDQIPCENDLTVEVTHDESIQRKLAKIHRPEIAVYKAEHPNGSAVIICPGGGYTILAYDWEGTSFAKWYNDLGVTAVVLTYRLPHWETEACRSQVALMDAVRAMRTVRHHAGEWRIDQSKIGVMGFSAGGHLASTLSTRFDAGDALSADVVERQSSRPDFSVLVYPVISMDEEVTHFGSRNNLIGNNPSQAEIEYYSNERHVSADTPATMLIHSSDDMSVPVENSLRYYKALLAHHISASLMIYPTGGHGFSFATSKENESVKYWTNDLKIWLEQMGLINKRE